MSNLFDQLNTKPARSQNNNPAENFLVQVTGYPDTPTGKVIAGIRMDTGQEVKVFLRDLPDAVKARLRNPRPEVANFVVEAGYFKRKLGVCDTDEERAQMMKGIANKTEPGGVIRVEQGFVDKKADGMVSARWITAASKFEGDAQVIPRALVRVNRCYVHESGSGGEKTYSQTLTVVNPNTAKKVETSDDLVSHLQAALDNDNGSVAIVRAGRGEKVLSFEVRRGAVQNEAGDWSLRPVAEAVNNFLASPNGETLAAVVANQEEGVTVEVIQAMDMALGSATKSALLNKGEDKLINFDEHWRLANGRNGFADCYVVFTPNKGSGNHVFMQVGTISTSPTFVEASAIPTAHIAVSNPALEKVGSAVSAGAEQQDLPPVTDLADDIPLSDLPQAAPAAGGNVKPAASTRSRGMGM